MYSKLLVNDDNEYINNINDEDINISSINNKCYVERKSPSYEHPLDVFHIQS